MSVRSKKSKLEEKMKILLQLIGDDKLSEEKRFELEEDYCFLQREYDNILKIEKLKINK